MVNNGKVSSIRISAGKRCALSTLGVFAAVTKGGKIKTGDKIEAADGI
ncbi:MAG: hypothetical protein ABIJ15_08800 [bacterium]